MALLASGACSQPQSGKFRSDPSLAELERRFSIRIVTSDPEFPVRIVHREIEGSPADAKAIEAYIPMLVLEWNIYPPDLVKKSRLARIVLCRDLRFAGQRRSAVPDFEHRDLYLDVERGNDSPMYVRAVLHHEFYHVIDFADDGELYQDDAWKALNRKDFQYGGGGKLVQNDSKMSLFAKDSPGFLTWYSMSGVEEDKAELFAHLVVNADVVEAQAKRDPILAEKVARLKSTLAEFCPDANDDFWNQAATLNRSASAGFQTSGSDG